MAFRVTLLGTGCPIPHPDRFGPCALVEAGHTKILVDAGRGATIRLNQVKVRIGAVDAVLLTHFHSDHVVGLPDLWLTGWLAGPFGGRSKPLRVIGPEGTGEMVHHLRRAFAADIRIRSQDERLPVEGAELVAEEFLDDAIVLNEAGLTATAFKVDHGPAIKPAFGYRFEYEGKSVVLSGDTRPCENLVRHCAEVDLLVHEVAMSSSACADEPRVKRVLAHHSSPSQVAAILSRTRPVIAVLTHLVALGSQDESPPTPEDALRDVRRGYSGEVRLGADLMAMDLHDLG